jgi:hypothetical protein
MENYLVLEGNDGFDDTNMFGAIRGLRTDLLQISFFDGVVISEQEAQLLRKQFNDLINESSSGGCCGGDPQGDAHQALQQSIFDLNKTIAKRGLFAIYQRGIGQTNISAMNNHVSLSNAYDYQICITRPKSKQPNHAQMQAPGPIQAKQASFDEVEIAKLVLKGYDRTKIIEALNFSNGDFVRAEKILRVSKE